MEDRQHHGVDDNEILIEVDTLNVDAASFTQIEEAEGGDVKKMAAHSLGIIAKRGKHHNPDTGSGGMLLGTVKEIGPKLKDRDLKVGDRIATLVSLSLTPLKVDEVISINSDTCQVKVKGQAILFETGIYSKIPADMDEALALAILDVAGAPAQAAKLSKPGQTCSSSAPAARAACSAPTRPASASSRPARSSAWSTATPAEAPREVGFRRRHHPGLGDRPALRLEEVSKATNGEMADLTINCVDIPNTEMASILATKNDGLVYFFSMATSFTSAALGAEGIGADTTMIIGNGYTKDHAVISLAVVRESPMLMEIFKDTYSTGSGNPEPVGMKASDVVS